MATADRSGACFCGAVNFTAKGNVMMNVFCHCKACVRPHGFSPAHLLVMTPPEAVVITKGADVLKTIPGMGKMKHEFCSECGCAIAQYPEGATFKAVFPVNFHIDDGPSCLLPDDLKPTCHINYENRLLDATDGLPKFKCFPPGPKMDDAGNVLAE